MSLALTRRRAGLLAVTAAAMALTLGAGVAQSAQALPRAATSRGSVACTGANTKVTAQQVSRPINHLLLTVRNTGRKVCYLYGYPAVQVPGAQAVPPVVDESRPQAVVTLKPGRSGYAGVLLSSADGSGGHGETVKSFHVWFQNRALAFTGSSATVHLRKGVYADESLRVTYWETSPSTALTW